MIRRIAVVIPAADEEQAIGACLSALATARLRVTCSVRVVVVLDRCTDGTADIVSSCPGVEPLAVDARNVGLARRIGTAHVLAGEQSPQDLLLASTDADSVVPADWLERLLELAADADLVLGTVIPGGELPPLVERAWFARHDLADGHPYVHAANLAIRATSYLQLGQWQPLESGEDEELVRRAVLAGLRITRTAQVPVRTSTRAFGRAARGFSSYLRALGHA